MAHSGMGGSCILSPRQASLYLKLCTSSCRLRAIRRRCPVTKRAATPYSVWDWRFSRPNCCLYWVLEAGKGWTRGHAHLCFPAFYSYSGEMERESRCWRRPYLHAKLTFPRGKATGLSLAGGGITFSAPRTKLWNSVNRAALCSGAKNANMNECQMAFLSFIFLSTSSLNFAQGFLNL